jgi:hypothetical protein
MNFSNIFKKKEEEDLTVEERRKKALITLIKYAAVFLFIIVLSLINKGNINNTIKKEPIELKEDIMPMLEKITNNYQSKITIESDEDVLVVEYQIDENKELISRTYKEITNNYFKLDNKYYEVDLDNSKYFENKNAKIYNDYDTTFLDVINIKKLITNISKEDIKNSEYNIARYNTTLLSMIHIYNELNGTNLSVNEDATVVIDVSYSDEIKGITIDMAKIHNIIKGTSYNKLIYNIEYSKINNIDLSSINI